MTEKKMQCFKKINFIQDAKWIQRREVVRTLLLSRLNTHEVLPHWREGMEGTDVGGATSCDLGMNWLCGQ